MKTVWLWVVFVLVYGVFSMKSHAAGMQTVKLAGGAASGTYRLSH